MIFHLTSENLWNESRSRGEYAAASLASEGFIHFSTFGQILSVANLFYKNCSDPVLLAVENNPLEGLKWEGENGLEFPHLYRPLKTEEVITVIPLLKNERGEFVSSLELEQAALAMKIETPRLLLREFQLADADKIHSYATDPDLVKFMPWGPNSIAETRGFLTRKFKEQCALPRTHFDMSVEDRQTGELLGSCGIVITNVESQVAFIGYILKKSAHGKGFATEFAKALVKFGFDHLNLHRIEATCDSENLASYKVMVNAGMEKEGVLRQNLKFKNRRRDTFICSVIRNQKADTL